MFFFGTQIKIHPRRSTKDNKNSRFLASFINQITVHYEAVSTRRNEGTKKTSKIKTSSLRLFVLKLLPTFAFYETCPFPLRQSSCDFVEVFLFFKAIEYHLRCAVESYFFAASLKL